MSTPKSDSSTSSAPQMWHVASPTDSTRILRKPLEFGGSQFLTTATEWTKKWIFEGGSPGSASVSDSGYRSPPILHSTGQQPVHTVLSNGSGRIVFAYDKCAKVWEYTKLGELRLIGSTQNVDGTVISASPIAGDRLVLEVRRDRASVLQVHRICKKDECSLAQTLILPPSSHGPGPYRVFSKSSRFMAVVTSNGLVSLFEIKDDVQLLPMSGIHARSNPDSLPLLDLVGRWLVFVPAKDSVPGSTTEVILPPSDSMTERVVESLSNTAAASFKSISDAGKASFRHYWYGDPHTATTSNGNTNGTAQDGNKRGANSRLKSLGSILVGDKGADTSIQIIDIPTQTTICQFVPPMGGALSYLSCSPYDAVMVTASAKGDSLWSYDMSFVSSGIAMTGRYVRGRVPNRIVDVIWDSVGGFGIVTSEKGSLHWFNKRLSLHPSNKVWKLSGWNFESGALVGPASANDLLMLRHGQLVIVDFRTGSATWCFDIPLTPSVVASSSELGPAAEGQQHARPSRDSRDSNCSPKGPDPLSYFELETCLPYPFIHTDRKVIISTSKFDSSSGYRIHAGDRGDDNSETDFQPPKNLVSMTIFGLPLETSPIDFGIPRGQVKFSPVQQPSEGADNELVMAMENVDFESVEPKDLSDVENSHAVNPTDHSTYF